jgi:hypothetical protein
MIEHVDVLGLFLHVRTNIVRLHLNKLAYNNLQFSRKAIAEKQYFLAKQKCDICKCKNPRKYIVW